MLCASKGGSIQRLNVKTQHQLIADYLPLSFCVYGSL
jgi:hypothetical protein